ncbi:MAG: GntR family transcriptional regulator [Candidatus Hinthialibacter antarcticus]|nr:GntR family transcriptional regulator [Candidatus Hinthialibacter antarcticus]
MKIIDRQSPRKLYLQLVDVLLSGMESGELSVGSQLPTEDQLCTQQGVSKAVVRSAMQELARKGYVRKIPGKGTFVETPPSQKGVWLSTAITENMLDFGAQWDTEVVQKMLTISPSDLTDLFAQETGHQVFKVLRLRSIESEPVALELAYVSHDLCPGLPLEDLRGQSLLDIITQKYGIPIVRAADSYEVTTLDERESELLKRDEGEHVLLADRILYTSNNRVVGFMRIINVSTKHRITVESVRTSV